MKFTTQVVSLLALVAGLVEAAPVKEGISQRASSSWSSGLTNGKCTNPIVRKEWRSFSVVEKLAYLAAVQCLYYKPSLGKYPGAKNRYDDFNGAHITKSIGFFQGTGGIHFVGSFLPWHRYFVASYEKALREECYYQGGQPYWDWTQDSDDFLDSPVFDVWTGFGGNGKAITVDPATLPISSPVIPGGTGGGCVQSGWFSRWISNVGPYDNLASNPHCLARDFHPNLAAGYLTSAAVKGAISQPTIDTLQYAIEGTPNPDVMTFHGAGHFGVGGSAGDIYSSSSEPLFFLHHAQIDKIWWQWQQKNPSVRLKEINGPVVPFPIAGTPNVTLDTLIDLDVAGPSMSIRDMMNITPQSGPLCYTYV